MEDVPGQRVCGGASVAAVLGEGTAVAAPFQMKSGARMAAGEGCTRVDKVWKGTDFIAVCVSCECLLRCAYVS
jgi:hypothetical protein